ENRTGKFVPAKFEFSNEALRPALEYFSRGMEYGYSLGDCVASSDFNGSEAVESKFSYSLDRSNLNINVAVKKQSSQIALDLIKDLESTIRLYDTRENTNVRKAIIDNTQFRSDNDQVTVVTRLPRAGLDALLATNAK
ncbi:MAG TPA: hypothetical protein PKA82_12165, partial [Pyrinomonadaceae bacterium]|nr:hypothetical protein [Pyrinomonadaceae bacterium]